ncbi:Glyoxalase/bleomycin resistance protein/dioxygenase [Kribbella flavida DSM 17836]|uniref:Glyoxalase/bleomycin resistance protein/dioxygenase n=1 Tax=Kribbella flavida (strain DSM 17836 / JCM 10339 / NBRC 14399) TaxID=479435 RepID=D2PPK0_KRIFD|nr:VOC family protein [Kribbella flavida]ADB30962.1 Glyoxalase/bleomycin resistance protein/dioxygenase [Kribbella flavida DSM 17836]
MTPPTIIPRLVVPDPDAAIAFYRAALEADLASRFELDDGSVTHAELTVGGAAFSLTAEVPQWGLLAPASLGGSPTLVTLTVDDAPALGARMVAHGAVVTVPIEDRPYGRCEGRVRDPFGHLWIISHVTEQLSDDEVRRRLSGITAPSSTPATTDPAAVRRIVPDLPLADRERSIDFYAQHLSLDLAMDLDWVLTFVSPTDEHVQLILIRQDRTAPVRPSATIEVADVDAIHHRLVEHGFRIVHPLTTEAWGVRRFFVEDPNGTVVNVMTHVH